MVVLAGCSQLEPPPLIPIPPPPAPPRMIYLGRLDQAPIDPPMRGALARWLNDAPGFLQIPLARPLGLAADRNRLFACDATAGVVVAFDFEAQDAFALEKLGRPVAVAVARDGTIYVADAGRRCIAVYDTALRPVRTIPAPDAAFRPAALAISSERLLVADVGSGMVREVELLNLRWSAAPVARARMPSGVASVGARVRVADAATGRVLSGAGESAADGAGDAAREFARPKQLATDSSGRVFITDGEQSRLQIRSPGGSVWLDWTDAAALPAPVGVCVSADLVRYYRKRLPASFQAESVVFVSNQIGPPGIAVFALAGE